MILESILVYDRLAIWPWEGKIFKYVWRVINQTEVLINKYLVKNKKQKNPTKNLSEKVKLLAKVAKVSKQG